MNLKQVKWCIEHGDEAVVTPGGLLVLPRKIETDGRVMCRTLPSGDGRTRIYRYHMVSLRMPLPPCAAPEDTVMERLHIMYADASGYTIQGYRGDYMESDAELAYVHFGDDCWLGFARATRPKAAPHAWRYRHWKIDRCDPVECPPHIANRRFLTIADAMDALEMWCGVTFVEMEEL